MNRSRIVNFILAALVGFATAMPPTTVRADDTEIYLGSTAAQEGVRPNVLIILDTSGSMSATVEGTGKDRMDNMKEGFSAIMGIANNINVGLMRFTDPGGPVLWPVSYIDEDVTVIESPGSGAGVAVNVRVIEPNDDAEEQDGNTGTAGFQAGAVALTDLELDLIQAESGGPGVSTTVNGTTHAGLRVINQANNAEQLGTNIITGNQISMNTSQTNAVRFNSVPIPVGATIDDARIIFTADSSSSSAVSYTINGEDSVNPATFPTACTGCSDVTPARAKTAASVPWSPPAWSSGENGPDTKTTNLADIVQKIVDTPGTPGWVSGNPMVFIIGPTPSGSRGAFTFQGSNTKQPELEVTFTTGGGGAVGQVVGLRFQDVAIPQGAVIKSAFLEYYPAQVRTNDIEVSISGELADDAAPFTTAVGNLSGRVKTDAVTWTETTDWDDLDESRQTVDISSVIQDIVGETGAPTGWCGNNAMALFVSSSGAGDGPLIAEAFDNDPSRAPILRVDFDQAAVPAGACINTTVQSQVFSSSDDAEEVKSTGNMQLTGTSFDLKSTQINGLRFTGLPIVEKAEIMEAKLVFVARDIDTAGAKFVFQAEATDDAGTFTTGNKNISSRTFTTASVPWTAPAFAVVGESIETVDLSPIIQEVIDRDDWKPFNDLVIIQSYDSGGERNVRSFNDSPIDAPRLLIKVQGAGSTAALTVRTKLTTIVDGFDHAGFTPIVDTLYEAARYYRGENVLWGKQRGFDNASGNPACADPPHLCNSLSGNPTVRRNTRVSHPASWKDGDDAETVSQPAGCTAENLSDPACVDEVVTGSPTYDSPIEESCQANYIVFLTDGEANHNDSADLIKTDYGFSCVDSDGDDVGGNTCGVELAKFLFEDGEGDEEGTNSPLSGKQPIATYTIGFNLDGNPKFLEEMAKAGGGKFFDAGSATQLANTFRSIFADILSRTTSFATPSLSVNAFNKLFDLDDVYFSFFVPDTAVRWKGNVKRYQLGTVCVKADPPIPDDPATTKDESLICTIEILDEPGNPAIDPVTQLITTTAQSFWSKPVDDGDDIELGGAASKVPPAASRKVFTFTDLNPIVNPIDPDLADLSAAVNVLEDADDNGILDGLEPLGDPVARTNTQILLGDPNGLLSDAERADLIDWIRGRDVDDEDEPKDGDKAENRFTFSDPLHSSPVAITFGCTDPDDAAVCEANPVIKVFVGTNDGSFTMINGFNGEEEWVVYPQPLLPFQSTLRANLNGDHLYGIDGVPAPWIFDDNEDGIINPNDEADDDGLVDFVRVIIGQRRGGDNIFGFDVTPGSILDDPTATEGIKPKLMWQISGDTPEYPSLGETWSRPVVARMRFGTGTPGVSILRDVIAFGGGYDATQDEGFFGPSPSGNAIYIADALTGERLYSISSDDQGDDEHPQPIAEMNCPIPSDLFFFDSDGDGGEDRIYVGDVCGQVWRVDFTPDLTASGGIKAVVGKFAELSDAVELEDHRKIFSRPEVAQVLNTEFSTIARYDLVSIVTGNRDNPLNVDVDDRMYALRDFHVDALTDNDEDGVADSGTYTTIEGPISGDAGDLFDATEVIEDPEGIALEQLQTAKGWFITFTDRGEKSLAAPVILAGKLFVTTYLPEGVVDAFTCKLAEGSGRLYGVSVLTGGVVFNYDDADGTTNLTSSDKFYKLGSGIPSSAVPIFQEEGITLLIGGGGGATTVDPDIDLPRGRTFWYQQE